MTRQDESRRPVSKDAKNTPRAAATRWVGSGPCFGIGERGRWGLDAKGQTGWANVNVVKISHNGPWAPTARCPPDEMSDDRPTAAHVHTKGDRMDHTAGLGPYARISASKTTAIWYRYNTAAGQSQQARLPARCLSHIPGRQGRQGCLRTENILVTFDPRGFPASRDASPSRFRLLRLLTSSPLEFGPKVLMSTKSQSSFATCYIHGLSRDSGASSEVQSVCRASGRHKKRGHRHQPSKTLPASQSTGGSVNRGDRR